MFRRQSSYGTLGIAAILLCILALALSAGVLALRGRAAAAHVHKVPSEFSTVQAAIDAAAPGDTVQVAPGTYNGTITINKPISLVAESFDEKYPVNNMTVLDGLGSAATITIPPNITEMPVIRGFVIRNSGTGIQAQSPFILEYSYLHASTYLVNYMVGSGGINRFNIYFESLDDAIHMENTSRPLLLENNRIMYAGDDGIEISLQPNPAQPAPAEIDIWNNMIIGSREDGIQLVDFPADPPDTARRFVIVGNLVSNSKRAGIGLMPNTPGGEDYSGADVAEALRVYNNTFYGNDVGISGGDNLVAFNNIIANSTTRGASKVQGPPGANSVVAYTLFFNNGSDTDQVTLGPGMISGQDPLFAGQPDPGPDGAWGTVDDNFSRLVLSPRSPAIDKGVAQYVTASGEAVPPNPITGFSGSAPDLGWRELGSPAIITPTATLVPTMTLQPTNTPFVVTQVVTQIATGTALIPGTGATATATVAAPTQPPPPLPTATRPVVTNTPVTQPTATQAASPTPTATLPTASPSPTAPAASATPTGSPVPATATATAASGLTILKIEPASAQAGTTLEITVTGTGFVPDAIVNFEGAQGLPPLVTKVQLQSSETMVITVMVPADTPFGQQVWGLRITNPDLSTFLLQDAFTVVPAQ
jgi:nitrous oxidase accessory protein NosD